MCVDVDDCVGGGREREKAGKGDEIQRKRQGFQQTAAL